jgi:hypothetical protein
VRKSSILALVVNAILIASAMMADRLYSEPSMANKQRIC